MKNTTLTTISALLLGASGLFAVEPSAAYTKPSGFETLTISPGFNMIGLRLQNSVLLIGQLGTPAGDVLPTNIVDLSEALGTPSSDNLVILEVLDGSNAGTIIEVSEWSGGNFTNVAGLIASLDGSKFQARKAPSISDLFGVDNSAGFLEGTLQTADVIWVSRGGGNFTKYFYSPGDPSAFPVPVTEGWKTSVGADASSAKINYIDGLFIERRGTEALPVVITGTVKTEMVTLDVQGDGAFNYYSGIFPTSTTLTDSKLSDVLTHGDITTGDVVWMPNGPGIWKKFTYRDADPSAFPVPVTEGWKNSVGVDASDEVMTSGFIIQRRGAAVNVPYEPNALYGQL